MKKLYLSICFVSLVLMANAQIDFFEGTYQEALEKAKSENKPVFVDAYAVWCGPCKWMDANTFKDADVAAFYNANFINLKLDAEKSNGREFAGKYRVTAYPTFFFLRADGSVVKKVMGAYPPDMFLSEGRSALESFKD
ncbi:MAG: thioredoxin family protein [Chitinophagales bacterium]